ncbi:heme NO-binding domain-containing protein [Lutibacter sp. TH_r2]|uniref:heme NO-binding domain-containing protein n=1 Tax=Lutibacter sp. TH_r2 TaxID=3082083 RepID=UPI0029558E72|nr:heme NO-binding domain-containing protein [Lutibacter sp. TH_r2]MDV7186831.1 heme NO-binding domain-containing protein [Lutibacter sp. TH_r2]
MKGIVFTEFLEMVEETFGLETVDYIIYKSDLKSKGVYTSVGTYDFFEMLSLISNLSEKVNIPVNDLIYAYGLYFFSVLHKNHSNIMDLYETPFDMISSIENHIHIEVRKLYPGAELPTFKIIKKDDDFIELIYYSDRGLYMFAKALMEKTFEHFNKQANIEFELLKDNGSEVRFLITQKNGES